MSKVALPTFSSLSGALSSDIPVGEWVQINGKRGAGNVFKVTNSARQTDGGTCFVFDDDRSAEQSVTTNATDLNFPDTDLIWDSFKIRYGPDAEDLWNVINMHGAWTTENRDWLDFKNGIVEDSQGLYGLRRSRGGGDSYDLTYRYQYATSDRRLERKGVRVPKNDGGIDVMGVNPEWWGAPIVQDATTPEASPHINWALLVAERIYNNHNIDWSRVYIPAHYYYWHPIRMREGTKLYGVGQARNVPGASWSTYGKLTTKPERAVYHLRNPVIHDSVYDGLNATKAHVNNHYNISKWGIERLELDGNYPNNTLPFDESDDTWDTSQIEGWVQNSGDWAGFHTNGAGNQSFAPDAVAHFHKVNAHHHGGNNLTTRPNLPIECDRVRTADSVRNHSFYHMWGADVTNVLVQGYSWEVGYKIGSKNDNTANYTGLEFSGNASNPEGYNSGEIFNLIGRNITIDDFLIDARGSFVGNLVNADKVTNNILKNGTIQLGSSDITFLNNRANGGPSNDHYKDINVYSHDGGSVEFIGGDRNIGALFENITVDFASGVTPTETSTRAFTQQTSSAYSFRDVPDRTDFKNVQHNIPTNDGWIEITENGTHPRGLFLIDSSIDNQAGYFPNVSNLGQLNSPSERRASRIYLDNFTLNIPFPENNRERDLHGLIGGNSPEDIIRMRNCQDRNGRVSDQVNQSFTSGAGDEGNNVVYIPTNLMSYVEEYSTTLTSGATGLSSITGVRVTNGDGSLEYTDANFGDRESNGGQRDKRDPYLEVTLDGSIPQGETVTIEWTARVTPLDAYQTTGLFISRPVFDQSYATGGGPFTVDLRGVAISQEENTAPTYTVSSGDTSVVTASVQSDGYTLELTEQGTGTATITVDAEISGVGTAQTTFDVTIS